MALDLFTEQGFDGTSLRQIAERLDVTKAALYYHFESKDDILMALHLRLHEFGKDALVRMGEGPVTLELWGELLDEIVGQMLAQRKIFLMHERNQAALEKLHRKDHEAEHEDIQNRFRLVLADTRVPLRGPGAHGRLHGRRLLEPLPLRRRLLLDDERGIGEHAPRHPPRRPPRMTGPVPPDPASTGVATVSSVTETTTGAATNPTAPGHPYTLSFDIGGTGIKADVLDTAGAFVADRVRVPTTYPMSPDTLVVHPQSAGGQAAPRRIASPPASPAWCATATSSVLPTS